VPEHDDRAAGKEGAGDLVEMIRVGLDGGLGSRQREGVVLAKDRRVQLLECRPRFDPEALHERDPRVLERLERLGLPT
jgi:hypothetical protein